MLEVGGNLFNRVPFGS